MKNIIWAAAGCALGTLASVSGAGLVTFESVTLDSSGVWNGSDGSGGVTVDGVTFANDYDTDFGSWSGFAVSRVVDTTTAGFGNQYAAYSSDGRGFGGSANYAIGYWSSFDPSAALIELDAATDFNGRGAWLTNTTYTALTILDGDGFGFARAFGPDDYLLLTLEGWLGGSSTGTVEFYLADYRGGQSLLVSNWTFVDFSALGTVDEIRFSMSGSDTGEFGLNTPAYFAMDNSFAVPEPSAAMLAAISFTGFLLQRRRVA